MTKMACGTSITGYDPIDLYTLAATAFIQCEVLSFYMKTKGLHNLVYSKPKALSTDEIIRTLKTKLQPLKAQGLWSPAESKKVDTQGDMDGLKLSMKNMAETQKRRQTGLNV